MRHLKIYDNQWYENYQKSIFEKYTKFIYDKFELGNHPFGKIELDEVRDTYIQIYIRIGGDIDPKYLNSIINFFENCDGKITIHLNGEYLFYELKLSNDFLKELDAEMNAEKYNL